MGVVVYTFNPSLLEAIYEAEYLFKARQGCTVRSPLSNQINNKQANKKMTKRKATIDYILINWRTEWEVLGKEEVRRMGSCIVCT